VSEPTEEMIEVARAAYIAHHVEPQAYAPSPEFYCHTCDENSAGTPEDHRMAVAIRAALVLAHPPLMPPLPPPLPKPGDGCQCTPIWQDAGGGHTELLAEYEPSCPEHSEHVWDPRTGRWELRSEDDIETQAKALDDAADAIQALHPGETKNSVVFLRERAQGLRERIRDRSKIV